MLPRLLFARPLVRSGALLACTAVAVTLSLTAAGKRPITKPSYDPSAESVELFEGIEQGSLDVTVIPQDSFGANVFIENKTNKPLTVRLPKAVATVQVLKQAFGGAAGFGGGMGGMGGGQGGTAQAAGGGFGGMGGMGGGMMGGGMGGGFGSMPGIAGGGAQNMGFFSVPSAKVVQVPLTTVCLEHGKPDPMSAMRYKLVPIEKYTSDPVLQELMVMVGTGALDRSSAQAAAWNVANNMGWDKLATKAYEQINGQPGEPYFNSAQLAAAQSIVSQASAKARDRGDRTDEKSPARANRRPETRQ